MSKTGLYQKTASTRFIDCGASETTVYYNGKLSPSDPTTKPHPGLWTVSNIPITSIRGNETAFTLPRNGFEIVERAQASISHTSPQQDIFEYINGVRDIIRKKQAASVVFCFDYKFRRNDREAIANMKTWHERSDFDSPATVAHVDVSEREGPKQVKQYLSKEEIEHYFNGKTPWRLQIINSWQPLHNTVEDRPLLLGDYFTTDISHYVPVKVHNSSAIESEIYHVRFDEKQRWYWLPEQRQEEMLLFLNYDSHPGSGPKFCPHSSFDVDTQGRSVKPRVSIEVRFAVLSKLESA